MKIKEEDIFKYVLFPDELDSKRRDFIKENEILFSEQIRFYESYLKSKNDLDIIASAKKVISKIPALQKIIILSPVLNKNNSVNKIPTLAAATRAEVTKKSESITFTDENQKYMIRLITGNSKSILYFFPKIENEKQRIKLTLVPSNETFHVESKALEIEINNQSVVEKVFIETD